ncbi:hypothetical protein R2601_04508 [Salipiger bermudensis HTCC2601]|uniref:Uncharacterized protein n=1 Tax=Salipiger bermudensis (strain DSM 26914 / JCM 13377 / KCTC 12554 / HTCC2601) TaxID=314265 RepID=Q0FVU4_SALBH|nr:hypothetical protein R2601_04508 [Salipiger bermudensis HTCC2601]
MAVPLKLLAGVKRTKLAKSCNVPLVAFCTPVIDKGSPSGSLSLISRSASGMSMKESSLVATLSLTGCGALLKA